jgi:hypothetical protein
MNYPNAKFLIYNCWEKDYLEDGTKSIAGSLLLDSAFNEEEAKQKVTLYKDRHDEYNSKYPSDNTKTRFTYIVNNPDWWRNYKVQ